MIIKLKCRKCDKEQFINFEDIEQNMNYKCKQCQAYMSDRDSSKFSNLLELDSFDILEMYDIDNPVYYENFEGDMASIKELYTNSPKELKEMILITIENLNSILKNHKSEYTTMVYNSVHNCFLEIMKKEHSKIEELLGIKDDKIF